MKKIFVVVVTIVFLMTSSILPVSAIVPGQDAAPLASSPTYGELQEMYFTYLADQQISLTVGTPEYYQYAQTQIYDETDPVLKAHPFYSKIRAYLIEYSALYQDYLYGISTLQQNVATGEQLIAQFSVDNPCLQYNAVTQKLSFALSDTFLNKTIAQSKAENEAKLITADQITMQNTATTTAVNYTYSPADAIKHARQFAILPNPSFPYYAGGDCTNFASQCLYAGGISMIIPSSVGNNDEDVSKWYCKLSAPFSSEYVETTSWIRAADFFIHMRGRAVQWTIVGTVDEVIEHCQPGDIVQLMDRETGRVHHSTIISKKDADTAYYCAHTNARKDADIKDHFEESEERFIILSFRALPSIGGVSLDTCEPCDDQVPTMTSVEFSDASLNRVIGCPHHNEQHDAEEYFYTYNIVCTHHGTVVGSKTERVYICIPEE